MKSSLETKGFFWRTLPGHSSTLKEVRAGTQAGAEAETMEDAAFWLRLSQLAFLYNPGLHAKDGATQRGLVPHLSIINQDDSSDMPIGQSDRDNSTSLRFPLPR